MPKTTSLLSAVVIWVVLSQAALGQASTLPVGEIIDTVWVDKAGQESYALYLPGKFRPSDLSPLLVIFHPAAHGRDGIQPFLEASEEYGFILVCSNDSKNGPYGTNYGISNRLFTSVLQRLDVDPARIYTAGFSGGARLASSIAVLTGQIQGVIACGAGFSPNQLAAEPDFSYAAVIGNRDFNYSEMQKTAGWLDRLHAAYELFEFDMGHQWPSAAQLKPVFQWLDLEAQRKGITVTNERKKAAIREAYLKHASRYEQAGELLRAVRWYERILRNFPVHVGGDSLADHLSDLKRSSRYSRLAGAWKQSLITEEAETARFYERFTRELQKPEPDISGWEKAMERLQARAQQDDPYDEAMVARIRATISAFAYEAVGQGSLVPAQQVFCYELSILAVPGQPFAYLALMDIYLEGGDPEQAFEYLEALLHTGFDAPDYLRAHPTVQQLRSHPQYKELLGEEP